MIKLEKDDILSLYKLMTIETGGTVGIREESLLESAIDAPFQTFMGLELYPTLIEKAARLGYGLVANHPFVDGNKRIGVFSMLVFLDVNGYNVLVSDDELVKLTLKLADGSYKYEELLEILKEKVEI
jgi:death-on-curing protein